MRQEKKELSPEMKEKRRERIKAYVYVVLRFLVVAVMIAQIFNRNFDNVFLCVLTLILFMIPSIIDRRLHIELPNTLEIIILLFIFSAEILGEIQEYYLIFPQWDTVLHTLNGFLMAAIGVSLVDILNENEKFPIKLSPLFVGLVAFCFSMTVGVLWEFFEFGMDYFFLTDMQKDTVLTSITSVMLNPEGGNVAVTLPIESVVINGEVWDYGGYIDIGLYDTMMDLFVNFIGAVVFSVLGWFYIRGRSKGNFIRRFIPRKKSQEEIAKVKQEQAEHREKRMAYIQNDDAIKQIAEYDRQREELKKESEDKLKK